MDFIFSNSPYLKKFVEFYFAKTNSEKYILPKYIFRINLFLYGYPNGHSTSNRRRFDVDITWIRWRPNFDKFPRHFQVLFRCNFADRKIYVVSTYFFRRNFDGWKIHVVFTYFFRCNFNGKKIHVVSTYFFWCNFDGRKIHLVSTCFFRCNFFHWNIHFVFTYFLWRNFDGRIIHFVCRYFFRRNFD